MKVTFVPSAQDVPGLGGKLARTNTKSILGLLSIVFLGLTSSILFEEKTKGDCIKALFSELWWRVQKAPLLQLASFHWAGIESEVKWSFLFNSWRHEQLQFSIQTWSLALTLDPWVLRSKLSALVLHLKWDPWFLPLDHHLSWDLPHLDLVTLSCILQSGKEVLLFKAYIFTNLSPLF